MEITKEIIALREQGKTYQDISIKLNLSIGKIQRLLKGISDISIPVDKIRGQDNEIGQDSLTFRFAELEKKAVTKEEITKILEEFKENLLEKVQNAIELRIERAIKYYVKNVFNKETENNKVIERSNSGGSS